MKISIVIPVLNDVRVARALDSIFSQQHDHELEMVIVDAGSTDGTLEVLERYTDRISILISEPDEGIFDGMNKGIHKATGDVVGILGADDQYIDPFVFRDVMEVFSEEDIDACYGDQIYTNQAGNVIRYWKTGEYRKVKLYSGWTLPHFTFFVRKRVYKQYGVFDLQYRTAADYEFVLRLLFKHKINVKYLDRVLVNMAPGGHSNRSVITTVKANIEVARACRNNGMSAGFLVAIMKPTRKFFQYMSRP